MKAFTVPTAALCATRFAAAPAFAGPRDIDPDTGFNSTEDMTGTPYIGTRLPHARKRVYLNDPNERFPNTDRDRTGYVVGTAGPEKGEGDEYGPILFDVGAQP